MEVLNIYTRNLEMTERLRTYVERKVARFDRYLPNIDNIRVDLSESNARDVSRRMVAQITIYVPKAILRAEERASDIFAAVDTVMDKMYRRVERFKGRRKNGRRVTVRTEVLEDESEEPVSSSETEAAPVIVRVKEFEVSSVTPEDAIEQMELLDHHFFLFLDAKDGRLSVIYRREDGNYGMLKPVY
ncbi:MAG: ribosome-associated translation inhibitor RaiA [Anaerolineae bacterium]|nr:ribosome-associated translation inhibitor RaiA [Anaerolineae bacterium]